MRDARCGKHEPGQLKPVHTAVEHSFQIDGVLRQYAYYLKWLGMMIAVINRRMFVIAIHL